MDELDLGEICRRIALQPPYFAFSNLERQSATSISGRFSAEHRIGYERGPIAAAETVRHLATLGACAAVLDESAAPAYYLGSKAQLRVLRDAMPGEANGAFHGHSEVLARDKRSLVAHSTASSGRYMAYFHCEYQVLPEQVFARTFRNYRADPAPLHPESPYRQPVGVDFESIQGRELVARTRPQPSGRFAGHFPQYPAWPVCIHADTATDMAGRLLQHMLDKEVNFSVVRLEIDAMRLLSASECVSLHVRCKSASELLSHYVFSTEVRQDDVAIAAIEMEVYV